MSHILEGVLCHIDDVLVFGAMQVKHNLRLEVVLSAGLKKHVSTECEFCKTPIRFLGNVVDRVGIRADPAKRDTILKMEAPQSASGLLRPPDMANHLGKFSSEITQPLLSSKAAWLWGQRQEEAFTSVKEELTHPTVLAQCSSDMATKISADVSSFGLGAVLLARTAQAPGSQ